MNFWLIRILFAFFVFFCRFLFFILHFRFALRCFFFSLFFHFRFGTFAFICLFGLKRKKRKTCFFALKQKRMKRLVIYSSIAQVGFLVAALATNSVDGFSAIYFFLVIYIITSILVWNHVALFYSFQKKTDFFEVKSSTPLFLSSLSNLFKINSLWAFSFVLIFFSVAGIPPLSGFLSKIFILFGLIDANELLGSLFLVLISAVSVFYYIRVIKVVFFESKDVKVDNSSFQTIFDSRFFDLDCVIISSSLFLLLFCFFYPTSLLLICQYVVLGSYWF